MNTTRVAIGERRLPVGELAVDRDSELVARERQAVARAQLLVQRRRGRRAGHDPLVAQARLLAQHRVVLDVHAGHGARPAESRASAAA